MDAANIALLISGIALIVSIISLWANNLSPFSLQVTHDTPTLSIYEITPSISGSEDGETWWIPSFNVGFSFLNAGRRPGKGERVREAFLPSISPVEKGWIISKSLKRLEVASLPGSVVRATAEGRVLCASNGKVMIDHENGLRTGYENLERVSIKVGERVKKGAAIGYSGKKGISYQVGRLDKEIDPLDYMGNWR